MTTTGPTVVVVDDDPDLRNSVQTLLAAQGLPATVYASGREFLAAFDPEQPGCIVLDLVLSDENGIQVLDELRARSRHPPVIILTAHGSVPTSVQALRGGAIDFLEKPTSPPVLVAHIKEALEVDRREREQRVRRSVIEKRTQRLSGRERAVARLLVEGKRSKEMAAALGISVRTVEGYRARLLEKMQAESTAQLVTLLLDSGTISRS
jgi:FixJ family two-component response regulator